MDELTKHTETWHIFFKASKLKHWVFKILDPYIQHCYAVKESEGGEFWIILDSKNCCTHVRIESKINYPHVRMLDPDSAMLSIRAIINPAAYQYTPGINSCVDVCKGVLGLKRFWVWTPYQLYRYLYGRRTD